MIKVVAKCVIKKSAINEFKAIAEKLIDATRANDAGCLSYELFQDSEAENVFVFVETWESMALLGQHAETTHFKQAIGQITPIAEQEMVVNVMNLVK